jgi:hypothetical protein
MFVSPAFSGPTRPKRERRDGQRFAYPATVQIDGRPAPGRDISPKGLSVFLRAPAIGDIVRVTLAAANSDTEEISSSARIVRVDRDSDGFVVGLEFID